MKFKVFAFNIAVLFCLFCTNAQAGLFIITVPENLVATNFKISVRALKAISKVNVIARNNTGTITLSKSSNISPDQLFEIIGKDFQSGNLEIEITAIDPSGLSQTDLLELDLICAQADQLSRAILSKYNVATLLLCRNPPICSH